MHIAVLSDPANFHTQKWTLALKNAGIKTSIFSFSPYQYEQVPCIYIPPNATYKGNLTYASYLYSTTKLRKALIKHNVDIINPINITPFAVWATRSTRKPIISTAMGADILEYPPKDEQSPLLQSRNWSNVEGNNSLYYRLKYHFAKHIFRYHVQKALNASDFIIADNRVLIDAMHKWFNVPKHKMQLNRWGIEKEQFDQVSPQEIDKWRNYFGIKPYQKVVLSPRGAKAIYQADIILKAFAQLIPKHPDTHFIMFSAGYRISEQVRALAKALSQQYPNFTFQQELIPRTAMYAIWQFVDIFISAPIYDGYSNAVSEGRYVGAIPVLNRIPATQEIIQHQQNGWVVHPFTPNNLIASTSLLLADLPHWKHKFHQANKKWIIQHSLLSTNIQAFIQNCKHLLENHPPKAFI